MSQDSVCLNIWRPECATDVLINIKTDELGSQGK